MSVLSDIDAILIRATYNTDMSSFTIRDVRMDIAVPSNPNQNRAPMVENCVCPEGYTGLSCQVMKMPNILWKWELLGN